jgi:hypothetical protein
MVVITSLAPPGAVIQLDGHGAERLVRIAHSATKTFNRKDRIDLK